MAENGKNEAASGRVGKPKNHVDKRRKKLRTVKDWLESPLIGMWKDYDVKVTRTSLGRVVEMKPKKKAPRARPGH